MQFREVREGQTLAQALSEEMMLRGHNNEDAAREMGTSNVNVWRWHVPPKPSLPDGNTQESLDNIALLVKYLRLRDVTDYWTLYLNSKAARTRKKGKRRPR